MDLVHSLLHQIQLSLLSILQNCACVQELSTHILISSQYLWPQKQGLSASAQIVCLRSQIIVQSICNILVCSSVVIELLLCYTSTIYLSCCGRGALLLDYYPMHSVSCLDYLSKLQYLCVACAVVVILGNKWKEYHHPIIIIVVFRIGLQ